MQSNTMLALTGRGVSHGMARGTAFDYVDVLQRDADFYRLDPAQIGEEQHRIELASRCARRADD